MSRGQVGRVLERSESWAFSMLERTDIEMGSGFCRFIFLAIDKCHHKRSFLSAITTGRLRLYPDIGAVWRCYPGYGRRFEIDTWIDLTSDTLLMPKFLNWSSLTFIATIASLAVPIWLWRADLNAKSLSFQLASQVPLTTETAGTIKGLEVLMDGIQIKSPTLSVVTLVNDGKKPLPTADFETPLELRILEGSTVVRAEVTSTRPKDMEAKITWDKKMVRFTPVLLNPDETITVSILSEGAKPTFSPRARIIGVSSVDFVDSTKRAPVWQRAGMFLVAAVLLFAASDVADVSYWGGPRLVYVRKRAALLLKTVCGIAGLAAYLVFTQIADIGGLLAMVASLTGTILVGTVIATALNFGAKPPAGADCEAS